jgi:MFS family permease
VRSFHLPVWLGTASRPRARTFAALFAGSAFSRTLLITVVPLQAHSLLGDAQKVSLLYFGVSLAALSGSLAIPWLVRQLNRRTVFTLGATLMGSGAAVMTGGTPGALVGGFAVHIFGVACLEITLNLYLLDHVPRNELGRFEPMRIFYSAAAWTLGPWLGVYLGHEVAPWTPYMLSALFAGGLLTYFWVLRLTENPAVAKARRKPPNPLNYLPRFFRQPRLRLAWFLAFGRSAWWAMFFIYAPIYAVTSGLGEMMSGAIVSLGTGVIFLVPIWGWVARRFGVRRLLMTSYTVSGLASLAIALASGLPWLGVAILLGAAVACGALDGAGNVPFLRAVHPPERAEMTTVFATYRDASQFAPPGLFALLLRHFELPAVFVAGGLGMLVLAHFARYLPRRL